MTRNPGVRRTRAAMEPGFGHPCESDGYLILDVESVEADLIYVMDDDGGIKENADGTERMRMTVVLYGGLKDPRRLKDGV